MSTPRPARVAVDLLTRYYRGVLPSKTCCKSARRNGRSSGFVSGRQQVRSLHAESKASASTGSTYNIYNVEDPSRANDPITVDEFEEAFLAAWKPVSSTKRRTTKAERDTPFATLAGERIGIAVSGGADSMALAYLCRKLQEKRPFNYDFHAIVINHNARLESWKEADDVAAMLSDLGMDVSVKTLHWNTVRPLEMSNFETGARALRFQQIGNWCRQSDVRYLMLGHHQDDQVETVLVRMLGNRTGAGLSGIKQMGSIPACEGLWKVSEGPAREPFDLASLGGKISHVWHASRRIRGKEHLSLIAMAADGVSVHRPLLGFSKSRLKATCREASVRWKEDETNQDVSLTARNAVRSLLDSDRLPVALRKNSILRFAGGVARKSARIDEDVDSTYRALRVFSFDPRSGMVRIRLTRTELLGGYPTSHHQSQLIATGVIARISSLLNSAIEGQDAEALSQKVLRLEPSPTDPKTFTGGNMLWRLVYEPKLGKVYRVSRQPYMRNSKPPTCGWASRSWVGTNFAGLVKPVDMVAAKGILPQPDGPSVAEQTLRDRGQEPIPDQDKVTVNFKAFGRWQLFDDRFWIKVYAKPGTVVLARLFTKTDLNYLRRRNGSASLEALLNAAAPDEVRWTLPVLADYNGRPLALPTLGWARHDADAELTWDWMYRRIRPESLHPNFFKLGTRPIEDDDSDPEETLPELLEPPDDDAERSAPLDYIEHDLDDGELWTLPRRAMVGLNLDDSADREYLDTLTLPKPTSLKGRHSKPANLELPKWA